MVLQRAWKTSLKYEFPFKIFRPIDLNFYPQLINSYNQELRLQFANLLGNSAPFIVIASISRTGFLVNQCALTTLEVRNATNYRVLSMKIALMKNVIYQSDKPSTENKVETHKIHELSFGKPFTKQSLKYEVNFVIPETELSSDSSYCRVLNISYDIRIKVMVRTNVH